jgi:hypothetical protein
MQNPTAYILPIILVALAIFLRIKRSLGFQQYRPMLAISRITVCVIILLITFGFALRFHPETLLTDAIGVVAGLGTAYLGVWHVKLEERKDGLYYRTHVWVEVGILLLFFVRLAYRFYDIYGTLGNLPPEKIAGQLRYEKDPITGIIISVFCTYYISYFTYLIIQVNKLKKSGKL